MDKKDYLEINDLVPMHLANNCLNSLSGCNILDNKSKYQKLGESDGSFKITSLKSIIDRYYKAGALVGGLNQAYMLRNNYKEEVKIYLENHLEYFQYDYKMTNFLDNIDDGQYYRVKFPSNCDNNYQYLFDVINILAKEMHWNRSAYFMNISSINFVREFSRINYNEETREIELASNDLSRKMILKQRSRNMS